MTEVVKVIFGRRSVRKYSSKIVPKELLLEILDAARFAPSAHNAQPWRFIVLTETMTKRRLATAMAQAWLLDLKKDGKTCVASESSMEASIERFVKAPVLVVACLTMENMNQFPDRKRQQCEHDLAVQSLGAAIQNMLLIAHAKGLSSCWYCAPVFSKSAVRDALKIPKEVEPQALIVFGYAAEEPTAPQRLPIQGVAFFEEWSKPLQ
ncbi:MAG: nitroreductase family protein [Candidatus Bathyarchaeota archaeon]|nr:nitroreductase family protein [Candidatus Bathyarchaeota archaeon]